MKNPQVRKCVFCEIVAGRGEASIVYEDGRILAFMAARPAHPGEFLCNSPILTKSRSDLKRTLQDAILIGPGLLLASLGALHVVQVAYTARSRLSNVTLATVINAVVMPINTPACARFRPFASGSAPM